MGGRGATSSIAKESFNPKNYSNFYTTSTKKFDETGAHKALGFMENGYIQKWQEELTKENEDSIFKYSLTSKYINTALAFDFNYSSIPKGLTKEFMKDKMPEIKNDVLAIDNAINKFELKKRYSVS